MRKPSIALVSVLAVGMAATLVACKSGNAPTAQPSSEQSAQSASAPAAPANSKPAVDDTMTAQLQKLAGKDASDCGRVARGGDLNAASECAMQANTAKKPFYVRYDLPLDKSDFSIATVRTSDGKLYTMQYDSNGFQSKPENGSLSDDKKVATQPCSPENPLRIASSGRVTCLPAQTGTTPGASPHGMGGTGAPGMGGMMSPHGSGMPGTTAPKKSH